MSTLEIEKEVINIYEEMKVSQKSRFLLCPMLKILQMRYSAIDTIQAKKIIVAFLKQ